MDYVDTYINYEVDLIATGKNIRILMEISGYDSQDLETYLGCQQNDISDWQEGKSIPGFDVLLRLSGILKVPVEKIIVFRKQEELIPLKKTNSGFIRNNVFFSYSNATQVILRESMAFNKRYGEFPDKIIMNSKTFDGWIANQKSDSIDVCEEIFGYNQIAENLYAELLRVNDIPVLKTDGFIITFEWDDSMPERYYRLINTKNCSIK